MADGHGTFVWSELMTSDPDAAQEFYTRVIGWMATDAAIPGLDYRMLSAAGIPVAGLMPNPPGAPVMWVGYVGVADVDQTAQAIAASSGTVHKEPWDIPNVGRVAMVADPQGAMFALFKLAGAPPEPPPGGTPGHGGWRELHARDWQAAFGFYAPLFGWNKLQAVDMGPMGTYQLFGQGETQIGGMFNGAQAGQGASWLYYFNVESVDAAAARVGEAGGTRLMDIQQVPGGSWVVPCLDPQGARFAIVGPR